MLHQLLVADDAADAVVGERITLMRWGIITITEVSNLTSVHNPPGCFQLQILSQQLTKALHQPVWGTRHLSHQRLVVRDAASAMLGERITFVRWGIISITEEWF